MGKNSMKFPFLLKPADAGFPWQWPYCRQPRTHSFRVGSGVGGEVFKTLNSAYSDVVVDPGEFWLSTNSSEPEECCIETVIRGLRSERLFFEPGRGETSSILEEAKGLGLGMGMGMGLCGPLKESVQVVTMESEEPYVDFRASMEEMVEAHGLNDWESMEELLTWYLRVNGKQNHGYIIGAFVDLLVALSFPFPSSSSSTFPSSSSSFSYTSPSSSPLSFPSSPTSSTTPCLSSSIDHIEEGDNTHNNTGASSN